jgi:hypothetical protein
LNQCKVNNAKAFLLGQIELYKIQFAETGDNKYLEVMNELNKTIEVMKFFESALKHRNKNK